MDVLALERRDERAVQPLEDLVRDEVGLVFDVLQLARALVEPVERLHHLVQQLAALANQRGLFAEQHEEVFFTREQGEHAGASGCAREGVEQVGWQARER